MNVRLELLTGYDDFGNLIFLPSAANACGLELLDDLNTCPACGNAIGGEGDCAIQKAERAEAPGIRASDPRLAVAGEDA
ncbi:hypothetical protein RDV64_18800 [Acuticoccus sp. MNP-M23]|uniref:hypothetical protein n=1 Tax=Acuticoccus sp. MNP-M23 TaxID=3072793 RepID=UPI002814C3A8|nr:hypothetical protein [Acuticoccus sp. MNP-M23]WMS42095.1 hypothetical protein RDV64_18800 [Acuticoccus sp. MNP-M23]